MRDHVPARVVVDANLELGVRWDQGIELLGDGILSRERFQGGFRIQGVSGVGLGIRD